VLSQEQKELPVTTTVSHVQSCKLHPAAQETGLIDIGMIRSLKQASRAYQSRSLKCFLMSCELAVMCTQSDCEQGKLMAPAD
jgi:hypothetical protein